MDKKLIFLHIPKNGGSTFRSVLTVQYPFQKIYDIKNQNGKDSIDLPPDIRYKVTLLRGHCLYGIHQYLPGDSQYVTFLREPVDRAISFYYFTQNLKGPAGKRAKSLSLRDFALTGVCPELDNGQTRRISGVQPEFGGVNELHFQKAINNIDNHFVSVGVLDLFDESLLMIAKQLDWILPPFYIRHKVNLRRPNNFVPLSIKNEIRAANKWDMKLYERYRARILEFGENSLYKQYIFKKINRIVGIMLLQPAYQTRKKLREWLQRIKTYPAGYK